MLTWGLPEVMVLAGVAAAVVIAVALAVLSHLDRD